ncbi:MAG: hypothetical protein LBH76_05125, partial [Propionibacteriaceae bacterium]|nr:hypothetical protein [Propionibacteriaceae bacterium]
TWFADRVAIPIEREVEARFIARLDADRAETPDAAPAGGPATPVAGTPSQRADQEGGMVDEHV